MALVPLTFDDKLKHILTLKPGDRVWSWELVWNKEKNTTMVDVYSVPIVEPFGVRDRYGKVLDFNENRNYIYSFYPTYMDALDDAINYFSDEKRQALIRLEENSRLLGEAVQLKREHEETKKVNP